jgi:hypothetical protein
VQQLGGAVIARERPNAVRRHFEPCHLQRMQRISTLFPYDGYTHARARVNTNRKKR